jgi:hypothetical protein
MFSGLKDKKPVIPDEARSAKIRNRAEALSSGVGPGSPLRYGRDDRLLKAAD